MQCGCLASGRNPVYGLPNVKMLASLTQADGVLLVRQTGYDV